MVVVIVVADGCGFDGSGGCIAEVVVIGSSG